MGVLWASASQGLTVKELRAAVGLSRERLEAAYDYLLEHPPLGLAVQRHGDGLCLVTAPDVSPSVERHLGTPRPAPLSRAASEVLAIIAYRQPIARAGIELIRGSGSDSALDTLLQRGLVEHNQHHLLMFLRSVVYRVAAADSAILRAVVRRFDLTREKHARDENRWHAGNDGQASVRRARRPLGGPHLVGTTHASGSWHLARLTRRTGHAAGPCTGGPGACAGPHFQRALRRGTMDEVRLSGGMPRTLYWNNAVSPDVYRTRALGGLVFNLLGLLVSSVTYLAVPPDPHVRAAVFARVFIRTSVTRVRIERTVFRDRMAVASVLSLR